MKKYSKHTRYLMILLISLVLLEGFYLLNLKKEKDLANKKSLDKNLNALQISEKNYLMGKFDPAHQKDFVLVPLEDTVNKNIMYLRKDALSAFLKMKTAAENNGLTLKIYSATRNFDDQKNLWNNKWSGYTLVDGKDLSESMSNELERLKKILEYSAIPGTSRHHFGTDIDIDINSTDSTNSGIGLSDEEYTWLKENAYRFGFCQPYNKQGIDRHTGYHEERWHWSYMPLSKPLTEEYKNLINDSDITGFLGDEYISKQNIINDYVLSINTDCI